MKRLFAGLTLVSASLLGATALTRTHTQAAPGMPQASCTPVVVELFTSEGCSSCPPADALLARLAGEQLGSNVQLIALEEHVDYWNDLGWVDPFSSPDWTSRQYVYAGALKNGNPYTPQMVVDGTVEFVGNHSKQARETILKAAGIPKIAVALVQGESKSAGVINFSAKAGKLQGTAGSDAAEVWLAITETGLHSAVTRGENAGEDLHHAAIVRFMRKIGEAKADREASFAGDATVLLKKEWKRENLRAVLFVQEKKSRRILGAAEIRIAE
ncbi:MAG TPA: DUF1223 domain-containing protein [Candidatus Acidoferrum sp.]